MRKCLYFAIAALMLSCGKNGGQDADTSIVLERGLVRQVVEELGLLAPIKSVEVRSEISGQLTEVLVDVGDRVNRGQVLARVRGGYEAEDYQIADIRSPISGVVIDRNLGPDGNKVEPGDRIRDSLAGYTSGTVLMKVALMDKLIFEVNINEMDVARIERGQQCEVTVDALPGRKYRGVLSRVSPVAKQGEREVRVFRTEVSLREIDEDLRPGMTARARIQVDECIDCVKLPLSRLYIEKCAGEDIRAAYVLAAGEKEPARRTLKVGPNDGQFIAVEEGLKAGEKVVSRPQGRPRPEECGEDTGGEDTGGEDTGGKGKPGADGK